MRGSRHGTNGPCSGLENGYVVTCKLAACASEAESTQMADQIPLSRLASPSWPRCPALTRCIRCWAGLRTPYPSIPMQSMSYLLMTSLTQANLSYQVQYLLPCISWCPVRCINHELHIFDSSSTVAIQVYEACRADPFFPFPHNAYINPPSINPCIIHDCTCQG